MSDAQQSGKRLLLDMTSYQWLVLFAAWLGWGFDVFDGLLFNFVAPNCVPTLLGLEIGSKEAAAATLQWTGVLTAVLLLGWAAGGILFGKVSDHIGRTKTLLLTMLLYAIGTAACAAAPNIWVLMLFRIVASLGIGGEWAAGASMVAEVVPEKRRVEAGAILYSSAPLGLFLATFVNYAIAKSWLVESPSTSWRWVFLTGLVPAFVALMVRVWVKEPERWKQVSALPKPRMAELFTPKIRPYVVSGLSMAVVALITWWSCNAFLPVIATQLAQAKAKTDGLDKSATQALVEGWKTYATSMFNLGGLVGTLLTVPLAKHLGRKKMFFSYFLAAGISLYATWGLELEPTQRFALCFAIGPTVFGVFGSFTYYLPELFPTRLRSTGAGFCYNAGRVVTAAGPFLVGMLAKGGPASLMAALTWVSAVPIVGLLLLPLVIETRGRELED
ncbi:MAG: MFS transporter [Armatimonadetes bacterium]|nr:MFS transporter [Armatimonadota bacterium]